MCLLLDKKLKQPFFSFTLILAFIGGNVGEADEAGLGEYAGINGWGLLLDRAPGMAYDGGGAEAVKGTRYGAIEVVLVQGPFAGLRQRLPLNSAATRRRTWHNVSSKRLRVSTCLDTKERILKMRPRVDLQVVGATLPRSGTTSLEGPLEIMGFDASHHNSAGF